MGRVSIVNINHQDSYLTRQIHVFASVYEIYVRLPQVCSIRSLKPPQYNMMP